MASKQHKKQPLIVNQNALDLISCVLLIVTYSVKMGQISFRGALGYWLCTLVVSECLIWWGIVGSIINLAAVTVERYLKVVHPVWSKNKLRGWMVQSAMAFAWIGSLGYNVTLVLSTSVVLDGTCYAYAVWKSATARVVYFVWNVLSFYVVVLTIFVFCYWRILAVIRHQASVMATHNATGP